MARPPAAGLRYTGAVPTLCALLASLLLAAPEAGPRTVGLFVAAGDTGPGGPALPTVAADATRVRDVLVRQGTLSADDATLLVRPTAEAFMQAFGDLEDRARRLGAEAREVTLVLWVGGAVEGGAVRLGAGRLELATLVALLQTSPAARRLALLDLVGGGAPTQPLQLTLETRGVPGLAVLTAQSADAAGWASPLTHSSHLAFHVANALGGAADADGDERITLPELVAWLAERSRRPVEVAAPGHWPALTSSAGPGLAFDAALPPGLYVVVDEWGVVAGEVLHAARTRRLGLPPGRYAIKRRDGERLRLASATVTAGPPALLDAPRFEDVALSRDPVRQAGRLAAVGGRQWSLAAGADARLLTLETLPSSPLLGVELTLHQALLGGVAVSLDAGYGWASGALAGALVGRLPWTSSLTTVGLSARYEWRRQERVSPFAGARLGLDFWSRTFSDPTWAAQSAVVPVPGAVAGLSVRLGLGLSLVARARVGYLGVRFDAPMGGLAADLGLLLRYGAGG